MLPSLRQSSEHSTPDAAMRSDPDLSSSPLSERIATYADTVLVFASPREILDLRRPLDDAARRTLRDRKLLREFAIVTADNPSGELESPAMNAAAGGALKRELDELRVQIEEVQGCSPDLSHRENSLAAGMDRASAVRIAIRYEQDAIFWFDGERFWLVGALLDFEPVPLPLDA